jgi:hypothetical protein
MPSHIVQAGYYLHWGVVQLSLANLLVIAVMLAVFVAALLLPFPGGSDGPERPIAHRDGADR